MVFFAVWCVGLLYLFDLPARAAPPAASVSIIALARVGIFVLPIGIASILWIRRQWKNAVIPETSGRLLFKAALAYLAANILLLWVFDTGTSEPIDTLATSFLAQYTAAFMLLSSWKFPARWRDALAGLGTATTVLSLLSAVVLLLRIDFPLSAQYVLSGPDFLEVILGVVAIPFLEEILFRVGVIGFLRPRVGTVLSIVFSAALFAALHLESEIFWARLIGGVAMGWLYLRTGSVISSFTLHAIINGGIIVAPILWRML